MAGFTFKKAEDYIYASTRVRIFERRLLSKDQKAQLLAAESYEEALRILLESPYGHRMDETGPEKFSYRKSIKAEAERLQRELSDILQGSPLLRFMALEDIYHNLKVVAKMWILDSDLEHLLVPVHAFSHEYMLNLLVNPEMNRKGTAEERSLAKIREDYSSNKDPERIELILDKDMYSELSEVLSSLKSPLLENWLRDRVDLQNLLIYLRMKELGDPPSWYDFAFIPGGNIPQEQAVAQFAKADFPEKRVVSSWRISNQVIKAYMQYLESEDINLLEKRRDELDLYYADKAKRLTYGPEVIFSYYIRRQKEMQNLQILILGLQSGFSAERLDKHLRKEEVY